MKHKDIAQKSDKELEMLLSENRKQLDQVRIDMRTKQLNNVKQIFALKKTIARVLTVQSERAIKKEEANG